MTKARVPVLICLPAGFRRVSLGVEALVFGFSEGREAELARESNQNSGFPEIEGSLSLAS